MLMHHLTRSALVWRSASQHLPECHAQRVEIRPRVQCESNELFGTSKLWRPDKTSRHRNCRLETRFSDRLCQTEIDNFCRDSAVILQTHQDVTRLDIAVNEVLFVYRSPTGGHLCYNLQRRLRFNPPRASDETLKGLSLHELHRIKVTAPGSAQVENRRNILVAHAGGGTRLAQET